MKNRTLSAAITFAALTAITGSAIAASAHDGYYQAFYGSKSPDNTTEMVGKAAYGATSGNAWSGHEAYRGATGGGSGAPLASAEVMGKSAYGTTSGPDGNKIYRTAFGSSD